MSLCFNTGEDRGNENLGLIAVHTLFMREHNRIASELSRLNPSWNDQTLFFETRKILIAIYQHIIFNEWLPLIIGPDYVKTLNLFSLNGTAFYQQYDPNINPSIANEFATAAFRYGHSMSKNSFSRLSPLGTPIAISLNISKTIFKTAEAYK